MKDLTPISTVDIERSVITKHVRNIIKAGELDENSVCAIFAHTAPDGKTYNVNMYNLDVILAVGYRTNSAKAVVFLKQCCVFFCLVFKKSRVA